MKQSNKIHTLAYFLYLRSGAASIVVVTRTPGDLINQYPPETHLTIACPDHELKAARRYSSALPSSTDFVNVTHLNEDFLKDKLLVCSDYLTWRSVVPYTSETLQASYFMWPLLSILSGKNTLRMIGERTLLLRRPHLPFYGSCCTQDLKRDCVIDMGGTLTDIHDKDFSLVPVLAVMHIYNEEDIIAATITHLLDQGVDVHVIDNWSTDSTLSIVESLSKKNHRITFERFPEVPSAKFELGKMLGRVEQVVKSKLKKYKWVMINDADEIRWSPWKGTTLQEAFSFVDSLGYNAIDYTVFDFEPTREGFKEGLDPKAFFKYGHFSVAPGSFTQIKTWRNDENAAVADSGGHHVMFPGQKLYPIKFLLGHYPIRSSEHGKRKIFQQRKNRFSIQERQKGWHTQYDEVEQDVEFIKDPKSLVNFYSKLFPKKYLIERISGIGIQTDSSER